MKTTAKSTAKTLNLLWQCYANAPEDLKPSFYGKIQEIENGLSGRKADKVFNILFAL